MKCYVYRSERKSDTYVYLATEDDFSAVPSALLKPLGKLEYALSFELTAERKLAKESASVVLENLKQTGFHLQMPEPLEALPSSIRQANSKLH